MNELTEIAMGNKFEAAILITIGLLGIFICVIASLFSLLSAFGNKRWGLAVCIGVLGPLAAIPYVFMCKEAEYQKSLMIKGLITVISVVIVIFMIWLWV